eukprot:1624294-Prymnesium_polylepis.1
MVRPIILPSYRHLPIVDKASPRESSPSRQSSPPKAQVSSPAFNLPTPAAQPSSPGLELLRAKVWRTERDVQQHFTSHLADDCPSL